MLKIGTNSSPGIMGEIFNNGFKKGTLFVPAGFMG